MSDIFYDLDADVDDPFSKKYELKYESCNLDSIDPEKIFSTLPWDDPKFMDLKTLLNNQKSRLNDYNLEEWHEHTYHTNYAKNINGHLRSRYKPELLTNAWTKFYECLNSYKIIDRNIKNNGKLNSLHLCEAPGAFITSLNHYLKSKHQGIKFNWLATTLNPYYEGNCSSSMIPDDRFIKYTLSNWDFCCDNTGDIMIWHNSQDIVGKAKKMGEIHLVTADGSIDCSMDPGEQESTVACLHFCEAVTCLQVLDKGGAFVLKLFTIVEHSSICLLYLLAACFEKLHFYKPSTSKPGNSEIYLICIGYKGSIIIEPYLKSFEKYYDSESFCKKAMFSLEIIPAEFLQEILKAAKYFIYLQYHTIGNNIMLYEMGKRCEDFQRKSDNKLNKLHTSFNENFVWKYNITSIHINQTLSSTLSYMNRNSKFRNLRSIQSSKRKIDNTKLENKTQSAFDREFFANLPYIIKRNNFTQPILNYTYGKPIEVVAGSVFIHQPTLNLYNKTLSRLQNHHKEYEIKSIPNGYFVKFEMYQATQPYNKWEKSILSHIINILNCMKAGEKLIIQNFIPLTQFLVGSLYILANGFDTIMLKYGCIIELHGFYNKTHTLNMFEEIKRTCFSCSEPTDLQVLGVVQLELLLTDMFHFGIFCYNSGSLLYCMKECQQSADILIHLRLPVDNRSSFTPYAK